MKKKIWTILLSIILFVNLITNAFSMAQTYDYSDYLTKQEFYSKIDNLENRIAMLNANYKSDIATNIVDFYKNKATNPFTEGSGVRIITKNSETDRIRWKITNSFDAMPYFSKRGPWHIQEYFSSIDDFMVGLLELHREMTVVQKKTNYHSEGYLKGAIRAMDDSLRYSSTAFNMAALPYVSDYGTKDAWVIVDYYGPEQVIGPWELGEMMHEEDVTKTDSGFIYVRVLCYDTTNLIMNCFSQYTGSLNVKTQEWSGWRQVGSEFDYFNWFDYNDSYKTIANMYNRFVNNNYFSGGAIFKGQADSFPGYKNTSGVWTLCFLGNNGDGLSASPTGVDEYFIVHYVPYFYDFGDNTTQNTRLALQVTAYSYRGGIYQMTLQPMVNANYGEWIRLDSRNDGGYHWYATNIPMFSIASQFDYGNLKIKDAKMSSIDISAVQLNDTMYYYSINLWFTLSVTTAQAAFNGRATFITFNKDVIPRPYSGYYTDTNPRKYCVMYGGGSGSVRNEWPDANHTAFLEFMIHGQYIYITNCKAAIPVGDYRYHISFDFFSTNGNCFDTLRSKFV